MRFRVLGPLEIEFDGVPVEVPGRKPRTTLGTLLLRAPEPVSVDSLIEVLWGDQPPPTARTALQVHISGLRRVLSVDPDAAIETRQGGYRISVDPESVDVMRFRALSASGRQRAASGDWTEAATLLTEALELWRGAPLSDILISEDLLPAVYELEEIHVATFEAWVEAKLSLGRHEDVIQPLERARAQHPMRERLHGLAALGLYRAGRQAEALECLARLRQTLSLELGIEPGPQLQELERQILGHDEALAHFESGPSTPREGRKIVVALVARFGADSVDPEANRIALERQANTIREIIETREGIVLQLTDTKLVSVFGVPQSHEDDAIRAAGASLAIQNVCASARVGIDAGQVLVDSTGSIARMAAADPVEAADQLTASARQSEVLITQSVLRLGRLSVDERAVAVVLPDAEVPRPAFRLLDLPKGPTTRSSPMVGRDEELAALTGALDRVVKRGSAFTVSLIGPPGVGKSKLVEEFCRTVADAPVLVGQCLSYGRDITFWPVAEMVKVAAGIRESDSPVAAMSKLQRFVAHLADGEFISEQVASVVGMSSRRPVAGELPWAVRKFLEAYGGESPLILVFEDIHWAERGLLDLIEYLGSTANRTLVICTARGELVEKRAGWGGGLNSLNLVIPLLDHEESRQLLVNLFDGALISEQAEKVVLSAAEGNPLFIQELLAMLIEDGTLARTDGVWQPTSTVTDVAAPPSVQALLTARLDRLSNQERLVLEHGALVGRSFREHDLDAFPALAALGVAEALHRLVEKDLLFVDRAAQQSTFTFRHLLVRDAAYQGMSKLNRAYAHEAYAALLEQRAGERLPEVEDIVGYHLEAAESYRDQTGLPVYGDSPLALRAARHLTGAGGRAFDREDMSAASGLLSRAHALLEDEEAVRLGVTWRLGIALFELGELAAAERVLNRGVEAAELAGDFTNVWWLRMELAELRSWRDLTQYVELMEIGRTAALELENLGDIAGVARAHRLMGHAYASRGELEEAIEHFEAAREYAEKAQDEREISQTPNLGVVHSPVPARRCLELIRGNLERVRRPDPDGLAGLGFVLTMLGRVEEADEAFSEAHKRAQDLGSRWKAANVGMYHGGALLLIDEPDRAAARLRPATETLQAMGERRMFSTAVALLAEALFRLGEYEQAMLATMLSEDSTAEDDFASQMVWMSVRAKILVMRGALDEAEQLAADALVVADRTDFVNMIGDAYLDSAFVLSYAGKAPEAVASARKALSLYERKQNDPSFRRASRFLEQLESPLTNGPSMSFESTRGDLLSPDTASGPGGHPGA